MKTILLIIGMAALLGGCNRKSGTPRVVIRAGDTMESVVAHFNNWGATEVHLSTYSIYVPSNADDRRSQDELRAEHLAENPYAELPPFALPNGLVVDLHSKGRLLTSISQEILGEMKLDHKTIDGFVGLEYDGDWKLIRE